MSQVFVAESPAAYARRPPLVVDSSVVAAAIFSEPELDAAVAAMRGRALCAPQLVDFELANVAWNKARRGIVSEQSALAALAALAGMDLARYPVVASEVGALAIRWEVTTYDAAYLWLAGKLEAPLATLDRALGLTARQYFESKR